MRILDYYYRDIFKVICFYYFVYKYLKIYNIYNEIMFFLIIQYNRKDIKFDIVEVIFIKLFCF